MPPTSAARPKRAAEEFAVRAHTAAKRPRFDPRNPSTLAATDAEAGEDGEGEDAVLAADVIGKGGRQTKRNAVNIDGYESDSDAEGGLEARAAERRRAQGKEEVEDEDEDMFAEEEEQEGKEEGVEGKKEVRFQDVNEIEGQVMDSQAGGRVKAQVPMRKEEQEEEEDSESSGDEAERDRVDEEMEEELATEIGAGGKKKHAPRLDAFNLRAEEDEGRFDAAGNFVRNAADPDAVNDSWLEGLSRKDMKRARVAQAKRDDERRRRALADDAILTSELVSRLISRLETGETALEALARLNRDRPKAAPKWKQNKQKQKQKTPLQTTDTHDTSSPSADSAETVRKSALESLTAAADALYSRGQLEVYDQPRELLLRQFRRETGAEWQAQRDAGDEDCNVVDDADEKGDAQFEYRWRDARDGGAAHGPFDADTVRAWLGAGYFGDEAVEFRRFGSGSTWNTNISTLITHAT